ncbi:MAG: glycosyltransferase family 2 protein [Myxococcaceae bacterium]
MPRTLVALLAHNESECIAETVRELRSQLPQVTVLAVDDGSSDDTAARALAAGAIVVRHPFNLGVAAGEATGLAYAIAHGFDRVIRMDGDGQHDPRSATALLEALDQGAELVVGSRFLAERTFESSGLRRAANRFLAALLTRLCGFAVTDPTSGYRAVAGRALPYFAEHFPNQYPEPESLLMASRRGFKVKEVAVAMRPRRTGRSSLTPFRSAFYMLKVCFALTLELLRPIES